MRLATSLPHQGCYVCERNGGAEGIRTLDPYVANVMLYQLSYCPVFRVTGWEYTHGRAQCNLFLQPRFRIFQERKARSRARSWRMEWMASASEAKGRKGRR